jgi:beta-lactamase regulating signal transducer with metallopeptidase domain
MTDVMNLLGGVLLRATVLMGGALLVTFLVQRRRPLIASNLLTAMPIMLLILPVLAVGMPAVSIPVWPAGQVRDVGNRTALRQFEAPVASRQATGEVSYGAENLSFAYQEGESGENSRFAGEGGPYESSKLADNGIPLSSTTQRVARLLDGQARSLPPTVWSWQTVVVTIYLLGVAVLLFRFSAGLLLVRRLRRSGIGIGGDWAARCTLWQNRLRVREPVELLASNLVAVPTTIGWWDPAIILPTWMAASSTPHRDAVLLHELAHIHRQDYRDLLLLHLAQCLYWCHPLVWVIRRLADPLREQACDDVCIHWLGDARTYRDALLAVARQTLARPQLALGMAMARTSKLSRRMQQIELSLGSAHCAPELTTRVAVACAVLVCAVVVALVQFVPRHTAAAVASREQPIETKVDVAETVIGTQGATDERKSDTDDQSQPVVNRRPAAEARKERIDPASLERWAYAGDEPTLRELRDAIDKAQQALLAEQQPDGAWDTAKSQYRVGVSSLALLALLKTGVAPSNSDVRRGLEWLERQRPRLTYEISLMIQALAAANDDNPNNVKELAGSLEEMQIRGGPDDGSWTYADQPRGRGDRSNAQFGVLGLYEAGQLGVTVGNETWNRVRSHWIDSQNKDGSWSYNGPAQAAGGTGSMTAAGIASLHLVRSLLRPDRPELNDDGTLACRADLPFEKSLDRARRWLGNQFAIRTNPGSGHWVLYYLAGVARAGRYSGLRVFVDDSGRRHDWYREGASFLIRSQNRSAGIWRENDDTIIATSFALLFLARGLEPVLVTKLQYGRRDADQKPSDSKSNLHPNDIANLMQFIGRRPAWPRQVTWQTVDVSHASVADLLQAPILYLSGTESPQFTHEDVALLKSYLARGGSLFVDSACRSEAFDKWFREFVAVLSGPAATRLKLLPAEHPVYYSEFNFVDEQTGVPPIELWGVEMNGRTAIVYSPHGLSCLWDKWMPFDVTERPKNLRSKIELGVRVGANVVSYLTRETLARERGGRN